MAKAAAVEGTINLVSHSANLWISLETNVDDYSGLGGMRTVRRGTRVRFTRGRATVPAAWREDIEATRGFGRDFFFEEDANAKLRAALGVMGPQVVSGQLRGRLPGPDDQPPLPDWDTMGARAIREALASGEVSDLQGALMWETRPKHGKARVQVMDAIGKAIRSDRSGDDDEGSTGADEVPSSDPSLMDTEAGTDEVLGDDDEGGL